MVCNSGIFLLKYWPSLAEMSVFACIFFCFQNRMKVPQTKLRMRRSSQWSCRGEQTRLPVIASSLSLLAFRLLEKSDFSWRTSWYFDSRNAMLRVNRSTTSVMWPLAFVKSVTAWSVRNARTNDVQICTSIWLFLYDVIVRILRFSGHGGAKVQEAGRWSHCVNVSSISFDKFWWNGSLTLQTKNKTLKEVSGAGQRERSTEGARERMC